MSRFGSKSIQSQGVKNRGPGIAKKTNEKKRTLPEDHDEKRKAKRRKSRKDRMKNYKHRNRNLKRKTALKRKLMIRRICKEYNTTEEKINKTLNKYSQ